MPSTAYEVAQYLQANGLGEVGGSGAWSINVSREPVAPEDAITVYDTPGLEPDTDELDLIKPGFQVRVRCVSYLEGFAKQEAIRDLLILPSPLVMGGSRYVSIVLSIDINSIGRDEEDRHLLVASYRTVKERT